MRSSSNRCSLRRRKRSKIRSAPGSRPSFCPSTAAATTQPAPNRYASSRKRPPTSRPRSTGRKWRRSGRVVRRTIFSPCSAAIRRYVARSPGKSSRCGTTWNASRSTWNGCAAIPAPSARVSAAPSWWRWRRTIAARSTSSSQRRRSRRAAAKSLFAVRDEVGLRTGQQQRTTSTNGAERHLPHRLRAHLRRLLLSDFSRHQSGPLCRG